MKKITSAKLNQTIFSIRSDYQKIEVIETEDHGRALFLDDIEQFAEADENLYHETMTKIPFANGLKPNKVLVIGGGDGGTVRECLTLGATEVDVCEIDEQVIETCHVFFPSLSASLLHDRVNVIIDDAKEFVKRTNKKYDLVLVDSTDPVGSSVPLFGEEFYSDLKGILSNRGQVVSQVQVMGLQKDMREKLFNIFYKNFEHQKYFHFNYPRGSKPDTTLFVLLSDNLIHIPESIEHYFQLDKSQYKEVMQLINKLNYLNS